MVATELKAKAKGRWNVDSINAEPITCDECQRIQADQPSAATDQDFANAFRHVLTCRACRTRTFSPNASEMRPTGC